LAGRFATLCCAASMVMISFCFQNMWRRSGDRIRLVGSEHVR
jgi:hypothetical protein